MLSKVAKRVRHSSIQHTTYFASQLEMCFVDTAPDLLRWGDFDSPFPRVAMGGYTKYYTNASPNFAQIPPYCPLLSQDPGPLRVFETPAHSPLFSFSFSPKGQSLPIIHDVSIESMTQSKCTAISISTNRSPGLLRRRNRQLLRTPSIERDFPRELFTPLLDNQSFSVEVVGSLGSSTHSHSSHSSRSNSNHSDYPLTPSTSIESGDEGDNVHLFEGQLDKKMAGELLKLPAMVEEESLVEGEGENFVDDVVQRPELDLANEIPKRSNSRASKASFSKAKSGFQ